MTTISPTELVQLIVLNNPSAVQGNLTAMQLASPNFQLTPQSFMDLFSNLPAPFFQNRKQALDTISEALNISIDNNGQGAAYLWQQLNQTQMGLKELVFRVFDENMPQQTPQKMVNQHSDCGCTGNHQHKIIYGFALLGVLFLIVLFLKIILKYILMNCTKLLSKKLINYLLKLKI